ncbi:hypothetical protein WKT22_01685 [Candidatus Lokiarchaeum ossiferum]
MKFRKVHFNVVLLEISALNLCEGVKKMNFFTFQNYIFMKIFIFLFFVISIILSITKNALSVINYHFNKSL